MKHSFIRLSGVTAYYLHSGLIDIHVGRIYHNYYSTGTMRLVLWDVENYKGEAAWQGTRIASEELTELSFRKRYRNLIEKIPLASPNVGNFTKILALEAYQHDRFVMMDFCTIDRIKRIHRHAYFTGSVDFEINGKSIEMRVESIHFGEKSPLLITLWACEHPVLNKTWSGHKVTEVTVDPSEEEKPITEVVKRGKCSRPPAGTYYMITELKSRDGGKWVREDYVEHQDLTSF